MKFAPDNETVAWLAMNTWVAEGHTEPQSEELKIYKNGLIRSIKCPLFIRDHWSWQNGSQIAIDCGGRHFAGWKILYDVTSLRAIATVDEAQVPLEKRSDWSLGDN